MVLTWKLFLSLSESERSACGRGHCENYESRGISGLCCRAGIGGCGSCLELENYRSHLLSLPACAGSSVGTDVDVLAVSVLIGVDEEEGKLVACLDLSKLSGHIEDLSALVGTAGALDADFSPRNSYLEGVVDAGFAVLGAVGLELGVVLDVLLAVSLGAVSVSLNIALASFRPTQKSRVF